MWVLDAHVEQIGKGWLTNYDNLRFLKEVCAICRAMFGNEDITTRGYCFRSLRSHGGAYFGNTTSDNWFTSVPLVKDLLNKDVAQWATFGK